jgi:hypothetical protein
LENAALDAESDDVRPVSQDVTDRGRAFDNLEPLLEVFLFLYRPKVEGEADAETSVSGISVVAKALTISDMAAGSFSGGEFFHLSRGFSSSQHRSAALGIGMAAVVGRRLGDMASFGLDRAVAFLLRRALASQFAI